MAQEARLLGHQFVAGVSSLAACVCDSWNNGGCSSKFERCTDYENFGVWWSVRGVLVHEAVEKVEVGVMSYSCSRCV